MTQPEWYPRPRSAGMLAGMRRYVIADPRLFVIELERCAGTWLAGMLRRLLHGPAPAHTPT